jgi:hypothetical protein
MTYKVHSSRRAFLKAGMLASLGLAAGCAAPAPTATLPAAPTATQTPLPTATEPPPTQTSTQTPSATPEPTATSTPVPTATHTPLPEPTATTNTEATAPTPRAAKPTAAVTSAQPARADLLAHYPQTARSPVSLVRHDGVWDGERILEPVVLQMLDAALVRLTGIGDAAAAWRVLFDPAETVGIKVNTISRYTTTPEVAYAVAQRLQEAGLKPSQIVIFDRTEHELQARGYTLNATGPGVRCLGAMSWEGEEQVAGSGQRVHNVMRECDALINLPALKVHNIAGFTSALKNHYGTIHNPRRLHGSYCDPAIPELNALPVIRDKTRLVIGDFLRTCPYDWNRMTKENLIAMSFDPVAHDAVGRQVLVERRQADGRPAGGIVSTSSYLETAVKMGLGGGLEQVDLYEETLTG